MRTCYMIAAGLFFCVSLSANILHHNNIAVSPITTISTYSEEGENFKPGMVSLIDQAKGNFLFRGNMPQINGKFAYGAMTKTFVEALKNHGKEFPEKYRLIDISFLNYHKETIELEVEKSFFEINPKIGSLWIHSLSGSIVDPLDVPEFIRSFLIKSHNVDGLRQLICQIHQILQKPSSVPVIIYMHCNAGKDRTGEAAACYLMHYKGYSYEKTVTLDKKMAHRSVHRDQLNAIRWYAFYLRDHLGMPTIGLIEGK